MMLHRILYNLFGVISIVNNSGYRLTSGEKRRIRGFAIGPRVFVSQDDRKAGELRVINDHGEYLYNIVLD